MTGKTMTGIIIDDLVTGRRAAGDLGPAEKQHIADAFKQCGITPPKRATTSERGWKRYLAYALKRARSNHPHNAKWKPLLGAYTAMQVAAKFEESL